MKSATVIFQKAFFLFLLLPFLSINLARSPAAYGAEPLRKLQQADLESVDRIGNTVRRITRSLNGAFEANKISFEFQKQAVTDSGECLSALVALQGKAPSRSRAVKQAEKEIFLNIRSILKKVLLRNENIIQDLQENTLDKLQDPSAFLKSSNWQDPQLLISMSSYWIGWNGYYTGLLLDGDDPMLDTVLQEAINGFSRAFIDFHEDAVIMRSLLGRALCYGKLKIYDKAMQDLKSVKKKAGKNDPLYVRCLYEEIRMLYETGNYEIAIRSVENLKEDFPDEKIPEEIRKPLENIQAKVLVALVEKQEKESPEAPAPSGKSHLKTLKKLRRMEDNPAGAAELYRYVQQNADDFKNMHYTHLGPVAAVALGDLMFEKKEYDPALKYYLPVSKDSSALAADHLEGVWFHTAYIYCKKELYRDALYYLKRFNKKFDKSVFRDQAASLYYAAATRQYRRKNTSKGYKTLIDAVSEYIRMCGGSCPEMSEAHFTMGKHYQKTGRHKKAATEFSKVYDNSPNYALAVFYRIQYYVDELEYMEAQGLNHSKTARRIYKKGTSLLASYGKRARKDPSAKALKPHLLLLESSLSLYGPDADIRKKWKNLKNFEKRFPAEKDLFLNAFKLRMTIYHRLEMQQEAEKELRRFAAARSGNAEACAMLKGLGEKFERKGKSPAKKGLKTGSGQHRDFALLTYDCLQEISCGQSEKDKYCDFAQLAMARIFIDRGQLDEAEAVYLNLLKHNNLSADAVFSLGLLYEKRQQWEKALNTWRKFSDGVKSGTYHWYESRYKTAFALSRLGDNDKACDILNITLVLHPDLGSAELMNRYLALKSEICKETPSP